MKKRVDLSEDEIREMIAKYLKIKKENINFYYLSNFLGHDMTVEYEE